MRKQENQQQQKAKHAIGAGINQKFYTSITIQRAGSAIENVARHITASLLLSAHYGGRHGID
jgi:hypothetical protein